MSPTEFIEEFKKLSPEGKNVVRTFVLEQPVDDVPEAVSADFKKITDRIFRENEELFRKLAQ